MKRLPIIATFLVLAAVAAMIALGIWQLQRATWKEALIGRYAANRSLPPMAYPETGPVADEAMFRKSRLMCVRVAGWRVIGGSMQGGRPGYRHIAECVTGAEGPGALIDLGVSPDPQFRSKWSGGIVDGMITTEPSQTSLIGNLLGRSAPARPMLIADLPAPGLTASARPSVEGISNNHLAYAIQWFLFAGVALIIYIIALRRRLQS